MTKNTAIVPVSDRAQPKIPLHVPERILDAPEGSVSACHLLRRKGLGVGNQDEHAVLSPDRLERLAVQRPFQLTVLTGTYEEQVASALSGQKPVRHLKPLLLCRL